MLINIQQSLPMNIKKLDVIFMELLNSRKYMNFHLDCSIFLHSVLVSIRSRRPTIRCSRLATAAFFNLVLPAKLA